MAKFGRLYEIPKATDDLILQILINNPEMRELLIVARSPLKKRFPAMRMSLAFSSTQIIVYIYVEGIGSEVAKIRLEKVKEALMTHIAAREGNQLQLVFELVFARENNATN